MKPRIALSLALVLSGCAGAGPAPSTAAHFTESVSTREFYRGNLRNADYKIDSSKYQAAGYQFAASPASVDKSVKYVSLGSRALTSNSSAGEVSVTALCVKTGPAPSAQMPGPPNRSAGEALQSLVQEAKKGGSVVMVTHPNRNWALNSEELLKAEGFELLEIASGNSSMRDKGDDAHPSEEELWDAYMTKKHRVFGAAADDADKKADFAKAWIQAWAAEPTSTALCEALRNGHFYSSRGARLSALIVGGKIFEVGVENWNAATDYVDFIGANGQLLDRTTASPARYTLKGGEGYVRAHVVQAPKEPGSAEREAWTQAYYVKYE